MGPIGNRYLQGQPVLPYPNVKVYANSDVFIDMSFVDHTLTPVVPTSINLELDDLTNSISNLGPVALNPLGSSSAPLFYPAFAASMTLQIAGSVIIMNFPYVGSQISQLGITFTAVDSVTGQPFTAVQNLAVLEICSIATVSGGNP